MDTVVKGWIKTIGRGLVWIIVGACGLYGVQFLILSLLGVPICLLIGTILLSMAGLLAWLLKNEKWLLALGLGCLFAVTSGVILYSVKDQPLLGSHKGRRS